MVTGGWTARTLIQTSHLKYSIACKRQGSAGREEQEADGKGKQGKCFMVEFYIISKTLPSREFNFSVGLWMNYDVVLRETEKKKIKGNRVDNLF